MITEDKKDRFKFFKLVAESTPALLAIFGGISFIENAQDHAGGGGAIYGGLMSLMMLFLSFIIILVYFLNFLFLKKKMNKFRKKVSIITLIILFSIFIAIL